MRILNYLQEYIDSPNLQIEDIDNRDWRRNRDISISPMRL